MKASTADGAAPVTLHYISEEPASPGARPPPASSSRQVQVFVLNGAEVCEDCGESLGSAELLAEHRAAHREEQWVTCEQCGKSLRGLMGLMGHVRVHRERSYTCATCGEQFGTPQLLREHNRTHSGAYSFSCDQCDLSFQRSSALDNHRLIYHPQRPTSFPCARCSKTFDSNAGLDAHQRFHLGPTEKLKLKHRRLEKRLLSTYDANGDPVEPPEPSYGCKICGSLFKMKYSLRAHMRMHRRDSRHCCPHCKLRFPWEGSLTQHLFAAHRELQRFKCGECGLSVTSRDTLYQHLAGHLQVQ